MMFWKKPLSILLLVCAFVAPVLACAPFYPEDHMGYISDEIALIIWDREKKVEHFIRRARFETEASQVGFVVPTPTEPEITAIEDTIFSALDQASRPKKIYERKRVWQIGSLFSFFMLGAGDSKSAMPQSAVEVFQRGEVAGQEYAVLKADDPEALAKWLGENQFPFPESNKQWAAYYIEKNYFLTAFRYTGEKGYGFNSEAVRMSFQADVPFYPYREPATDETVDGRSLRLYLLADERLVGETESGPWSAQERYSSTLEELPEPLKALSPGKRLTVFDDSAKTRKGLSDINFVSNPDQSDLIPEPRVITRRINTIIPLEIVLLFVIVGIFAFRRKKPKDQG
jgi:hypothetical protein